MIQKVSFSLIAIVVLMAASSISFAQSCGCNSSVAPVMSYAQPMVQQPMMTYQQPMITYQQPMVTYQQPLVQQPMMSYSQPMVTYQQPMMNCQPMVQRNCCQPIVNHAISNCIHGGCCQQRHGMNTCSPCSAVFLQRSYGSQIDPLNRDYNECIERCLKNRDYQDCAYNMGQCILRCHCRHILGQINCDRQYPDVDPCPVFDQRYAYQNECCRPYFRCRIFDRIRIFRSCR